VTVPDAAERTRRNTAMYRRKPGLRAVYDDLFARAAAAPGPGLTAEVGGGMFKAFAGDDIATDIVPAPWLDLAADAQALPFAEGALGNLVVFDVLHHLQYPARLFREAERVLAPGGRIVLMEPAITPVSGLMFRLFHEEAVAFDADRGPRARRMPAATPSPPTRRSRR
jgi:SAM-dependent methyltransferase